MSANDIASAYDSNSFSNEDLDALRWLNPELYWQVQNSLNQLNLYNNANASVSGNLLERANQALGIKPPESIDLMAKYNELVNTDEIKWYQTKINDLQWQIEKVDESIFNMRKSIEDQYAWTGMTREIVDAITADKVEALNRQKRSLQIDYNTNLNQYNSLYKSATDQFGIYKDQIALDRQVRQDSMQQLGFYYQYTPQGMADYEAAQYEAKTPNLDTAQTPQAQRMALSQALEWYYKDFWDIIQRDKNTVISDVMKLAQEKGIPLSQALQENFTNFLKNKPEFKNMVAAKYGMRQMSLSKRYEIKIIS